MGKFLSSLIAGLLLAGGPSVAQDKMGHGKPPPASAASIIAKATSAAPPDIGKDATVMGMVDGNMKELRKGTNGWMCMLDLGRQGREQHRSLCHQGDGRQPLGRERAAHHDPARRRRAAGALPNRLDQGGPWVMWKGTPYAHVMVPLTGAPKASGKKPAEKK